MTKNTVPPATEHGAGPNDDDQAMAIAMDMAVRELEASTGWDRQAEYDSIARESARRARREPVSLPETASMREARLAAERIALTELPDSGLIRLHQAARAIAQARGHDGASTAKIEAALLKAVRDGKLEAVDAGEPLLVVNATTAGLDHALRIDDLNRWLPPSDRLQIGPAQGDQDVPTPRAAGLAATESPQRPEENASERRARRLARFRQLGGSMVRHGDGWRQDGERGALSTLTKEEKTSGRVMSDKNDVRKDLITAMGV